MHISQRWPKRTRPPSMRMLPSGQFLAHLPHSVHLSSSARYKKELIGPPNFCTDIAAAAKL